MQFIANTMLTMLKITCCVSTLITVVLLVSMLSATNSRMGSGKPTYKAGRKVPLIMVAAVAGLVLCIIRLCTSYKDVLDYILLVINILCMIGAIVVKSLISNVDKSSEQQYRRRAIAVDNDKADLMEAKARARANKVMAKGGEKVVKAKVDTAVATERAKSTAVKAATVSMAAGALAKPKEAIEYAQSSGALAEGKELADKYADKYMGDMAPTVIDGQYKDVTEEAKAIMDEGDSALVERIKAMSRDALESVIKTGAEALAFAVEGKTIEALSDEVIEACPQTYVDSTPADLTTEQKAAFMLEKMSGHDE